MAKIIKNNSIGTCLNYVTRLKHDGRPEIKREWYYLGSDGVRFREGEKEWRKRVINDLKRPNAQRNPIKDPCGHTSLEFKPEDAAILTDELMLKIADEYMEKMGIKNTPYVIVKHVNTPHPHCHIVFSRVDYDGKILDSATEWNLNKKVCKEITRKYGLAWGKDKLEVDVTKLKGKERARYEIAQGVADTLILNESITDLASLQAALKERGISTEKLLDANGKVKTIIYKKGRYSFVASKIDKRFTPKGLQHLFDRRIEMQNQQAKVSEPAKSSNPWISSDGTPIAPTHYGDIALTPQQQQDYIWGWTIHVGDVYISFNPETQQPDVSHVNPDILFGGGLPFSPGSNPVYDAFYGELSHFDKEAFRRFRKTHPGLTNSEAMSMFKANYCQNQTSRIRVHHF